MLNALLLATILAVTLPPATPEYISDQADLLTPAQETELTRVFQDVFARQNTRLGLLTLSELDDDPKATAVRTINYWKMTPDSVVVLVSMNPRKIFLQPGSNLQYRFDEATSTGIIRDAMAPSLKAGRYGAGILNGFHAISNRLPGQATPPPNTVTFTEPVKVTLTPQPVAVAPDGGTTTGHPFLIFLGVAGLLIGLYFLVRYVLNKKEEAERARAAEDIAYQHSLAASRAENARRAQGLQDRLVNQTTYGRSTPTRSPPAPSPAPSTTTVIHNDTGGNDLTNAVMLNHILSTTPAPRQEYAPPPPRPSPPRYTPPPSPPRRSSFFDSDSSSGGGGGGFDFGDSGGGGSDGGGGGGGDF